MEEILTDFTAHPWAQSLLQDPTLTPLHTNGRLAPPPYDTQLPNTLMNETLKTPHTIRAWAALARMETQPAHASPELFLLLSLGTGLGAFKGYAHGGFAALVLDQAMAMCASMAFGPKVKTVEAWQRFKRPIAIPAVVLCRAVATEVVGRRVCVTSTIEDGEGNVYCEGGSTFLLPRGEGKARI